MNFWRILSDNRDLRIVVAGATIFSAFFSATAILRYEAFSFTDFDSAIFVHEAWKIMHGKTSVTILDGAPIWGNIVDIITVLLAPYFALFVFNPKSLFVLQAVASGFAAVPLFLIARRIIPSFAAVCVAMSYLFYPALWYANLYEYNPLSLVNFTLLMAFYCFETGRFRWFLFWIVLCIFNRLDMSVVTVMFGAYALWRRRSWRWVIAPGVLSVGWISFGVFVLIPKFRHFFGYFEIYYPQFGKSFTDIVFNIVTQPQILFDSLWTAQNGKFLFQLFLPVIFLSLGGLPEFFICIFSLVQHLISVRSSEHTILYHYTSTITPFIFISAIYGLARFKRFARLQNWGGGFLILFSFAANLFYGPLSRIDVYSAKIVRDSEDVYKKVMLAQIPPEASVVSSFEFSPMLAGRMQYYSFHYVFGGKYHTGAPYPTPQNIDVALINFKDPMVQQFRRRDSDLNARHFLEQNQLGVVDAVNSIVLFRRGYQSSLKLYETRVLGNETERLFKVDEKIALRTFNYQMLQKDAYQFFEFVFQWEPLAKFNQSIWMEMLVIDEQKRIVHEDIRPICYDLYPPSKWRAGEEVLDYYRMLLPHSLAPGDYKVTIAFFSPFTEILGLLPIQVGEQAIYRKTLLSLTVPASR